MKEAREEFWMSRRSSDSDGDLMGRSIICLGSSEWLSNRLRAFVTGLGDSPKFNLEHCDLEPSRLTALGRRFAPALIAADARAMADFPFEALREMICRGEVRILAVIQGGGDPPYDDLLRKGCSGVVPAEVSDLTLRKAIEAIFDGELWVPRRVLSSIARESLLKDRSKELTQRETDVHRLICLGLTNQQIADQLFISRETVRWHVRSLYAKLGVPNQRRSMLETGNLAGLGSRPSSRHSQVA